MQGFSSVLKTLQDLEKRAEEASFKSTGNAVNQSREVARLKKSHESLKRKRDELKQKLQSCPGKTLAEKDTGSSLNDKSLQEFKKLRVENLKNTYRLTGLSVSTDSAEERRQLCFDTFYQGRYHSTYYVELELAEEKVIVQHTLPYFLPVVSLAEKYLQSNIRKFAQEIQYYLNAHEARKQQVLQLPHKDLVGQVEHSDSFDFISFTMASCHKVRQPVTVKLKFGDLKSTIPSGATVSSDDISGCSSRLKLYLKKIQQIFKQNQLLEAFQMSQQF